MQGELSAPCLVVHWTLTLPINPSDTSSKPQQDEMLYFLQQTNFRSPEIPTFVIPQQLNLQPLASYVQSNTDKTDHQTRHTWSPVAQLLPHRQHQLSHGIASYDVSGWALLPASNQMNWNTKGKHDASETQTEVATTLPDMRMLRIGNCLPIVQVAAHFLLL